ncbi:MAG: uroporphyrinogen decarboxylase family protein [Candidatus Omnitrophica bacterium]|nr:uroporphyrinogen decarboxylase family protein [Candidatus Omnitrophota bacterium]
MTRRERVKRAIEHKPVDKIPKGELSIDKELQIRLLANGTLNDDFQDEVKVRNLLNMDLVFEYLDNPPDRVVEKTKDGFEIKEDIFGQKYLQGNNNIKTISHPVADIVQAKNYEFIPLLNFRTERIKRLKKETDFFIFGQLDGGFNGAYPFFGLENFLVYSKTNPEEIEKFIWRAIEYYIEKASVYGKLADGIMIGDDMADNHGTIMSPSDLRKLVFPPMKHEVECLKKRLNIPVFLHCDGNINEIMNDIVWMGFDGVHSLQPSAGMDIGKVKKEFGDRLCLMGNVDLNYLLPFGKPEDIRRQTIWLVEEIGKGSGYILSTCNILTKDIPAENVLAMYNTAEKIFHKK